MSNAKVKRTPNKASLCFQVSNKVGSLAKVLNIFAEQNLNMSKIQSMPVLGKPNEYNFYVDVEWEGQQKLRYGYTITPDAEIHPRAL